ncbi:hypothetical protein GCM10027160_44160 [Streptomyces calidiresistens]|uniref:Uncharacterized protein n=1 Tax=Streptomyces calidiresistens TaxID=1485586 RepID=A0A7W3T6D2_9ACTN|nr:hypothetical protein [Streptomyces calidiresistens]MBB0231790.1 hypothetical protein [Streptomyces calidiresistens]
MDNELTALAATGAAGLVQLMLSDAWNLARDGFARLLARRPGPPDASAELDAARSRLLTARVSGDDPVVREITAAVRARLLDRLRVDPSAREELRSLLDLAPEGNTGAGPGTVNNTISGGVQHGPVIQSGRIGGIPFGEPGRG